jgi:hypothetical protein
MYTRVVIFNCILILTFSVFLYGNIQPPEISIGNAREILCGTWINRDCCVPSGRGLALVKRGYIDRTSAEPDCGFSHEYEKIVHCEDGRYRCFWAVIDDTPLLGGNYRIDDHWTDRRGNIWFKVYDSNPDAGLLSYLLLKISRDSTTMECTWSLDGYPKRMDPSRSHWYTVYLRRYTLAD